MKTAVLLLALAATLSAHAQNFLRIRLQDHQDRAMANATVRAARQTDRTNDSGQVVFQNLATGPVQVHISAVGFRDTTFEVNLPDTAWHLVQLQPAAKELEGVTVLSTTRTGQQIENAPLKVEVLGREELEEEGGIRPANIASLIGDVSGIQIQQSSATSGNSNVRIQGLEGRYTQILRDGMPLFDGFSGGFGIMQIPPLDLKQIELVKGSASTLYGGGAIGGLINLISKRPTSRQEGLLLLNQTTLQETNLNTYAARRYQKVGYTFFGGLTRQAAVDVNGDGLSDVPRLNTVVLHPRLFWYPSAKTTLAVGHTATIEERKGGDMQVLRRGKDGVHQYFENNNNGRNTTDLLLESFLRGNKKLEVKALYSNFLRSIGTNRYNFRGRQQNYYAEASMVVPANSITWVGGVNWVGDHFAPQPVANPQIPAAIQKFYNNTVGAFVQGTAVLKQTTLEAGLRQDYHFTYGSFLLPRIAAIHHFGEQWAVRLGMGKGYKTPNALAPQTIDYDIINIQPLAAGVQAETSTGYNAEVNFKHEWGDEHRLFINHAFFLTRIRRPVVATEDSNGAVYFNNAEGPVVSKGFDTYLQLKLKDWELYGGYTFTIAERKYLQQQQFSPLTPKHRFAFILGYGLEDKWRFALEGSYTGRQYRYDYSRTPAYLFMAAMIARELGKQLTLVLNCENLLDYRQSRHEALYTGSISNPQFKPLWAPIDGRVINLSIRWNWAKRG